MYRKHNPRSTYCYDISERTVHVLIT